MDIPSSAKVGGQEPFQERLLGLVWDELRLETDEVSQGKLVEELIRIQVHSADLTKIMKIGVLLSEFAQEIFKTFLQ